MKRFESLDAFRGLCAISVVLYHMNISGSITETAFFNNSKFFVEFFFVLSGFVLAHGFAFKENLSFVNFIKARFFRIYPLHFFMFFVILIIEVGKFSAYKFGGISFNNIPFTGNFDPREILPNLLLIQSWVPFAKTVSFNGPSWSISIEFYLYILLFISISCLKPVKGTVWLILSFSMIYLMASNQSIIPDAIISGLSCFFGGAFIYLIFRKVAHITIPFALGSLLESMVLLSVFFAVSSDFEQKKITLVTLFLVTVMLFAYESGMFSKLLKAKLFQTAGLLSYSIYMTHFAILFVFIAITIVAQKITGIELTYVVDGARFISLGNDYINNALVIIIVSFVLLVSKFTYKWIELPGQRLGKKPNLKLSIQ